jgi:hypothetical protein
MTTPKKEFSTYGRVTDQIREMLKREVKLDAAEIGRRCGYKQTTDVASILCYMRKRGEIVLVEKGQPGRYGSPAVWAWNRKRK